MANAIALQALIALFEDGDYPDGSAFSAILYSVDKRLNGTITDTDIDGDGVITIIYGNCDINGTPTAISIDAPLSCSIYGTIEGEWTCYSAIQVRKIDTSSCEVILGTSLPSGTYYYELQYRQ